VPLDAAQARELLHQLLRDYMPAAARVPFASGTELSRVLPVATPQLLAQRCLSAGQNALRRRPLRGISRAIGVRPFDWEPSAFLRDLEHRVADSRGIVDMDTVAGTRTPQEDAALFYWCEFGSVVARAREMIPREAQVISLASEPESAGV